MIPYAASLLKRELMLPAVVPEALSDLHGRKTIRGATKDFNYRSLEVCVVHVAPSHIEQSLT